MKNTIENAKAFITKYRDERTHPVSVDYFAEMMTAYAASVRPDVVVPSENEAPKDADFFDVGYEYGYNDCIKVFKRLNQTLTFTENHEK